MSVLDLVSLLDSTEYIFVCFRTSREASQYWSLPILFCRSHNMTLTPAFLIDCAKADKWLMFLCHAQAAQFPKNQVWSLSVVYCSSIHTSLKY